MNKINFLIVSIMLMTNIFLCSNISAESNSISGPNPVAGTVKADNMKSTYCYGEKVRLSAVGSQGLIVWEKSVNNGPFVDIGARGNSLNISEANGPNTSSWFQSYTFYRVKVTIAGKAPVYSNSFPVIFCYPDANHLSVSVNDYESVCAGNVLNLNMNLSGGYIKIQWYESFDRVTFAKISGATQMNLPISASPNLSSNQTSYYKAAVTYLSCTGDITKETNTCTVTKSFKPVAGIIEGPSSVCGLEYTLSAKDYVGTFQWQYQIDGSTDWYYSSSDPSVTYKYGSGLSWRTSARNLGCEEVFSAPFTVKTQTAAPISISSPNNCFSLVYGNTVKLTATPGFNSYDWQIQNPGTSDFQFYQTTTIPNLDLTNLVNATNDIVYYNLKVASKKNECLSVSKEIQIAVYPSTYSFIGGFPGGVCPGASVDLHIDKGPYDAVQVLYRDASNNIWNTISSNTGVFHLPAAFEERDVRVRHLIFGCGNTIQLYTEYGENILVRSATFPTEIQGQDIVCKGDRDILYIVNGNNQVLMYDWSVSPTEAGALGQVVGHNQRFNWSPTFSGEAMVVCNVSTPSCGSTTLTFPVHVNDLPSVDIPELGNKFCVEQTWVILTGQPAGGTFSGTVYENPNIMPGVKFFAASQYGIYDVSYEYTDPVTGCSNSITKYVEAFPFSNWSTYTTPSSVYEEGAFVSRSAQTQSGSGHKSIYWEYKAPGDTEWKTLLSDGYHYVSISQNDMHMSFYADIAHDGYSYRLAMETNCDQFKYTGEYTITVLPSSSSARLANIAASSDGKGMMNLFPNPTTEDFNIETVGMSENFKVTITDLQGKMLYENSYSNTQVKGLGAELPAGTYIITVSDNLTRRQELLIKNK